MSQHLDAGAVGALAHVWEERGCLYCVAYFSDGQVDRCVDAAEVRALAEDWLSLKAERDDLTARVEALKQHNDDLDQQITKNDLQDATTWRKLREAEAERDRLWVALAFYAEVFNYVGDRGDVRPPVVRDNGRQARAAIAATTPPPGRTRPKDCSICRRPDCTREHACE